MRVQAKERHMHKQLPIVYVLNMAAILRTAYEKDEEICASG